MVISGMAPPLPKSILAPNSASALLDRPDPPESRRQLILEAAASLFRNKGYAGTSMRDIAAISGMLPGSLYFHFPSKEDIFLAVQKQGVERLIEAVRAAVCDIPEPWARLEAACIAHMEVILDESDGAATLTEVTPARNLDVWNQLAALRDEYEKLFRQLVDDLPLPAGTNRKYLRLALLGSMNWTHTWYRAGRDTPRQLAVEIVWLYRCGLDPE